MAVKKSVNEQRKIGKGQPPEGWQKGESGNPAGRPKGSKNRATLFKKWMELSFQDENPLTRKFEKLTVEDRMVLSIISKAIEDGDVRAFQEAMDSVYGKNKESIAHQVVDFPILNAPRRMSFEEWNDAYERGVFDK